MMPATTRQKGVNLLKTSLPTVPKHGRGDERTVPNSNYPPRNMSDMLVQQTGLTLSNPGQQGTRRECP